MESTMTSFHQLPAELRNMIYKLAFTPLDPVLTHPFTNCVSLAPQKALLYVSRQMYIEGMAHYKAATKTYWANTEVTLEVDSANDIGDIYIAFGFAKDLPAHAWDLIQKLTIIHHNCGWTSTLVKLDTPGVWRQDFGEPPNLNLSGLPQSGRPGSMFVAIECSPEWFPEGARRTGAVQDEVMSHSVELLEEAEQLVSDGKPVPMLQQIELLLDLQI